MTRAHTHTHTLEGSREVARRRWRLSKTSKRMGSAHAPEPSLPQGARLEMMMVAVGGGSCLSTTGER